MSDLVNIHFHYGGRWVFHPDIQYLDGEVDVVENFDRDYLLFLDIRARYLEMYGYLFVSTIFVLKPGKSMNDGLFLR